MAKGPVQISTILRLNTKLESQGLDPMTDLVNDFSTGVKLIQVSIPAQRDSGVVLTTSTSSWSAMPSPCPA